MQIDRIKFQAFIENSMEETHVLKVTACWLKNINRSTVGTVGNQRAGLSIWKKATCMSENVQDSARQKRKNK